MNKKAQAAMEFLMTYGWAIIIVLAAIGALAYFGVLSPSKLLPERTIFPAPLPNVDNALISKGSSYFEIAFKNDKGVTIQINGASNVTSTDCTGSPYILQVTDTTGAMFGGSTNGTNTDITNGAGFSVRWACTPAAGAAVGGRFKADSIVFYYKNKDTGQVLPASGSIDGKWSN